MFRSYYTTVRTWQPHPCFSKTSSSSRSPIFLPRTPSVPSIPHSFPPRRAALCRAPLDERTYHSQPGWTLTPSPWSSPVHLRQDTPSSSASHLEGTGRSLFPKCFPAISSATCTGVFSSSPLALPYVQTSVFVRSSVQPFLNQQIQRDDPCDYPDRLVWNWTVPLITSSNVSTLFSSLQPSSPHLATVQQHWLNSSNAESSKVLATHAVVCLGQSLKNACMCMALSVVCSYCHPNFIP